MNSTSPQWRGRQFHYQPVASHVHPFLVELWDDVRAETGGRVDISVHAENAGLKATHSEIIDQVRRGDLEFYIVMGSLLGPLSPAFEIQGMPFAFTREDQVYALMDGALGDYLRADLATRGIYAVPCGLMENGFRHISTTEREIRDADDLAGLRIRVPEGRIFDDTFKSLGAVPTPVFVLDLHRALAERRVDAQENPLAITQSLRLDEVTTRIALTSHMWSGFNLIANPAFWHNLGTATQEIVLRNVRRIFARQRAHTMDLNRTLEQVLAQRGMRFNRPDGASFRRCLAGGFYTRWKAELGPTAWALLEAGTGKLA
ncbi:MAG: TRAP transporter substrate-binding protein [Burkholderiales bacterium]